MVSNSTGFVRQESITVTERRTRTCLSIERCNSILASNPARQSEYFIRSRYHGGRRPSSDDSLHSPFVIPPSALDKPSIMKHYHRRRTCSHTSPRRSPTMVTLHDIRFVECRWWHDGWTVKTVVTGRWSASMIPAPEDEFG